MTDEEMKQLIHNTMETQYEADALSDDEPTRANPRPPATPEQIARLEQHIGKRGLPLPPSFAQLLRICNGIENYLPSMRLSIRSAAQIEESVQYDSVWKDISPAHQFVFASGETSAFVGFIPGTADERKEMQVVLVTESADTTEYASFDEFLEDQLEYYRIVIRAERADRKDLKDD